MSNERFHLTAHDVPAGNAVSRKQDLDTAVPIPQGPTIHEIVDWPGRDADHCADALLGVLKQLLSVQNALGTELNAMAYRTQDNFGTPRALAEYCGSLMAAATVARESSSVVTADGTEIDYDRLDRMIDKVMLYREPL